MKLLRESKSSISVLGYRCFLCEKNIRRYPAVVWDGDVVMLGKQEYGHICFHQECARVFHKKFAEDLE